MLSALCDAVFLMHEAIIRYQPARVSFAHSYGYSVAVYLVVLFFCFQQKTENWCWRSD